MTLNEAVKRLSLAGVDEALPLARIAFREIGGVREYELLSGSAECDSDALSSAVDRLCKGEPIDYILGYRDFYRERYKVSPAVLIPRPETELLVDFAVSNIPRGERLLDLCTGSGCIGISTLKNTRETTAVLADLSRDALKVARENAEANGVLCRCEIARCDALREKVSGEFYAVLSNPPYVADAVYEGLDKNIFYEPKMAFVGGHDGGDFYRAITPSYKNSLKKGGFIAYEIGFDQEDLIKKIALENGMRAKIINDLSGLCRVAILTR